jgi:hypothetical protein
VSLFWNSCEPMRFQRDSFSSTLPVTAPTGVNVLSMKLHGNPPLWLKISTLDYPKAIR